MTLPGLHLCCALGRNPSRSGCRIPRSLLYIEAQMDFNFCPHSCQRSPRRRASFSTDRPETHCPSSPHNPALVLLSQSLLLALKVQFAQIHAKWANPRLQRFFSDSATQHNKATPLADTAWPGLKNQHRFI